MAGVVAIVVLLLEKKGNEGQYRLTAGEQVCRSLPQPLRAPWREWESQRIPVTARCL